MNLYTITGQQVTIEALQPNQVRAYDIAWALSQQIRYNGHIPIAWDVLSHTGLAFMLYVHDCGGAIDPKIALGILLHDAAEAYVGDVVGGLRRTDKLDGFNAIEEYVTQIIFRRFNLLLTPELQLMINRYDHQAAAVEIEKFFPPEIARLPGCTQYVYQSSFKPSLVKGKVADYIDVLKGYAIGQGAQDLQELFELPDKLKALLQQSDPATVENERVTIEVRETASVEGLTVE